MFPGRAFWAFAAAVSVGVIALGCGSGSSSDEPAATPTLEAPAATPDSAPIDLDAIQFETVTGPQNSYTISVPVGWAVEDPPAPGGFARRYVLIEDGARKALIMVRCQGNMTVTTMVNEDSYQATARGGHIDSTTSVTAGDLDGTQVDFVLPIAGTDIEQRAVYFDHPLCGWRVVLQAFGSGLRQQYAEVFDRSLSTFQITAAAGTE